MILDLLLGFLADAAVTGAQSRRVPKALRIVLTVLIALFLLVVSGFMLLCAVAINDGVAVHLVCGGIAVLCLGYLAFFLRGVWRAIR